MSSAKEIIPAIARNLAHLEASLKCDFVTGSTESENMDGDCSMQVLIWDQVNI
ncbi:MAG: hypothetical protein ACXWV3_10245 [Flavisolibacter sp.]